MDELDVDYEECDQVPSLNSLSETLYNHHWEAESVHSIEDNNCDFDFEKQLNQEKDTLSRKLWLSFQTAACSVAQLYKDRESGLSFWVPFQNAATDVTSLYKECIESAKRNADICIQLGIQRRNRELLAWAKKRKRVIRRDDLIAYLRGDHSNLNHSNFHHHHHHHYPHVRQTWSTSRTRATFPLDTTSANSPVICNNSTSGTRTPPINHGNIGSVNRVSTIEPGDIVSTDEGDLQTFREALALSANVRNSHHSGACIIHSPSNRRTSGWPKTIPNNNNGSSTNSLSELNEFISNEYTRHVESRKRANSTTDVNMDSPTHKKTKLN